MAVQEHVVLVDANDREIGSMEKLEAHQKGVLHRAFSVIIFNEKGEMLLQKRALNKYHTGGLSNACCSHPRKGEPMTAALNRKLDQEMGFTCDLMPAFSFTYRSELADGLIENELDHVFIGRYMHAPKPNPEEVSEWRYESIDRIRKELMVNSAAFTPWFHLLFEPSVSHFLKAAGQ